MLRRHCGHRRESGSIEAGPRPRRQPLEKENRLFGDLRDLRGLARQLALELASYLPLLTILLIHLVLDIVDSRVRQVKLSTLLRKNLAQLRLLQMQLFELFL